MSGIKLQEEINWVMKFKNQHVTRPTAEAIVDSRLCAVTIRFDHKEEKWVVEIHRDGELIYSKKTAFSNRAGVTSCLWHFVGEGEEIPWMRIFHGHVWRVERAIMDYRFWQKVAHPGIENLRSLLFLQGDETLVH